MILVIGGTGTTGGAVLEGLSRRGVTARALVRRWPAARARLPGVQVVIGQVADQHTLCAAMAGVDQVFIAMGNGPQQRDLELAVIRQAAASGVGHIVKVSSPADGPEAPVAISRLHHELERMIQAAGSDYTFLRPYAFFQNLLNYAPMIRQAGFLAATTGDAPLNMIDVRDVADVAVIALTTERTRRKTVVLTGPETISYPDVARRLTMLGRPTRYVTQDLREFRQDLQRRGLPPWVVDHLAEIQTLAVTYPEYPTDSVARITGREPRRLDDFLAEQLPLFQSASASATGPSSRLTGGRRLATVRTNTRTVMSL